MKYADFQKSQKRHHRCVACGKTFSTLFDEKLNTFPIFHPASVDPLCEMEVFGELLRIYMYIQEKDGSISMKQVITEFPWLGKIMMKKEMVHWCLQLGYLTVDSLGRIEVPGPVRETCLATFESMNLNDPEVREAAIHALQAALSCFQGELVPVPEENIPMYSETLDRGSSTLYDKIDMSKVKLRREREGMVTAAATGAREIDIRTSSARSSRERRRLEGKHSGPTCS